MSHLHEVTDPDKGFLLRFSLGEDARKLYDAIQGGAPLSWITILDAFNHHYRSCEKQTEISARLHALRIDSLRDSGDEDPTALRRVVHRINKLCGLALPRDNDDDAKARFIHQAVIGTDWGFYDHARVPPHSTYQVTLPPCKLP